MNVPLLEYLPNLLLTLVIEIPVVLLLLGRRCGVVRSALAAALASISTNPLLWYVWPRVVSLHHYTAYVVTGETLVVLLETAILWGVALRPFRGPGAARRGGVALGVSLLANALSLGIGMAVHAW